MQDTHQRELEEARSLNKDLTSQVHELQSQISTLGNTNELQSELSELKEECARLVFEKGRSLEKEHDRSVVLESVVSDYKKECARLTFELGETKESLEEFRRESDDSRSLNNNLTEQVDELQTKISILETAMQKEDEEEECARVVSEKGRSLEKEHDRSAVLESGVSDFKNESASITFDYTETKESLKKFQRESDESRSLNKSLSEQVEELQAEIFILETANQALMDEVEDLDDDIHIMEQMQRSSSELLDARFLTMDLSSKIELLQKKVSDLQGVNQELVDQLQSTESDQAEDSLSV